MCDTYVITCYRRKYKALFVEFEMAFFVLQYGNFKYVADHLTFDSHFPI